MSEAEIPDDSGATRVDLDTTPKRALSDVELRLTPADLKQPGVQKLLIDRLYSAEAEIQELKEYRKDFHTTRELLIEAQSAQKRYNALDAMQSTQLGIGCLIIGFLPYAWSHWAEFIVIGVAGLCFLGASIRSKRVNK